MNGSYLRTSRSGRPQRQWHSLIRLEIMQLNKQVCFAFVGMTFYPCIPLYNTLHPQTPMRPSTTPYLGFRFEFPSASSLVSVSCSEPTTDLTCSSCRVVVAVLHMTVAGCEQYPTYALCMKPSPCENLRLLSSTQTHATTTPMQSIPSP